MIAVSVHSSPQTPSLAKAYPIYAASLLSQPFFTHVPATMPMFTKDFIVTFPSTEFYGGQASPRALDGYIFQVTHLLKEANDNISDSCLELAIAALSGAAQEWILAS